MTPATIRFDSHGVSCEAWHFAAASDVLTTEVGRPCVVMAHGLAGTRDSGLAPFAEELAAAGMDVLAFDYRGFGTSGGSPRQVVSLAAQRDDYLAALDHAGRLEGVDPSRLVLWGVSLSGGHVLAVAAGRDDIAAVVALAPLVDGLAAARHAIGRHPPTQMLRATARGIRARTRSELGREPLTMPVVALPGEQGAFTLDGAREAYLSIAGPTWRNEVGASVTTELGTRLPLRKAADVTCPVLVQITDLDRSAPPQAAAKAAFRARARVHHYPCDHFDVFSGFAWHDAVVTDQVRFLSDVLRPTSSR
jgi:pimeloyl-ACP methyl ester carboxylesterase